jgi:hypothetical protein
MLAFEGTANQGFLGVGTTPGSTLGSVANSGYELAADSASLSTELTSGNNWASSNLGQTLFPIATNLDLFRLPPGTNQANVTRLGTFSFNTGTNTITYTPLVPVPEPSTALFGCAMVGSVLASRRRLKAAQTA